jgi:hypothetical protein
VALSPDGALLASAGQDRSWKLWDVQSGENLLAVLMQNSWGDCTCLTRSGTRMIVNFRSSIQPAEPIWIPNRSHKAVLLWNMHSGALEHRLLGHSGGVGFARLSVMKRTGARQSDLGATIQLFSVQECGVLS